MVKGMENNKNLSTHLWHVPLLPLCNSKETEKFGVKDKQSGVITLRFVGYNSKFSFAFLIAKIRFISL